MGSIKIAGMVLVGFVALWTFTSVEGGEWDDYLNSRYQDFRWNWLLRDGHLAYGQGKYNEALGIYHDAMKRGCEDPLMLFRMGYSYRALRKNDEAVKYLASCKKGMAEVYPKHKYNSFSRYYLAELFFEKALRKPVTEEQTSEYYRNALKELEEAVKWNPKFGQAFLLHGNICYRHGKYELAAQKYQRAYEINPKSAQALVNLGASYIAMGKYKKALEAYIAAKGLLPGDAKISLAVAGIYAEMKKPREALAEYENVLKVQPDSEKALVGAGNAAWERGENEKAIEYYERALGVNLSSYEALLGLGLAMLKTEKTEQLEKAEEYFRKCLEAKPDSKEAHYNLGVLYDSRGEFERAIKEYSEAIAIDPDDESYWYSLGLAFIKAGDYEQAREWLNKAIETFGKESKWSQVNLKLLELIDKIEKGKETEVEKELEKARKEAEATKNQ